MVMRLVLCLLPILLCRRLVAQGHDAVPEWHELADVPLPGKAARFDYQSFDASTRRLWIAHMGADEVLALDVRRRAVAVRVFDMPCVTGVHVVPGLQRVFAALSAGHEVAVLDSRTGEVLVRVPGGRFPDGLAYAPGVKKLYVSDEYGQKELVIDVPTSSPLRPIPAGGEVGNTQYDSVSGRIWIAVQSRDELAAIDPVTDSIVERVPLPGIKHPHGFYLNAADRLAYVSGEGNATLGVLDLRARRVLHTYRLPDQPDVLAHDPVRGRLYVAAESGVISPFHILGDSLVPWKQYRAPHAHSVAVDPGTGLMYVPLENVGGRHVLRILRLD
jgi:DNA-binding beta-propeller fold protein YncE